MISIFIVYRFFLRSHTLEIGLLKLLPLMIPSNLDVDVFLNEICNDGYSPFGGILSSKWFFVYYLLHFLYFFRSTIWCIIRFFFTFVYILASISYFLRLDCWNLHLFWIYFFATIIFWNWLYNRCCSPLGEILLSKWFLSITCFIFCPFYVVAW